MAGQIIDAQAGQVLMRQLAKYECAGWPNGMRAYTLKLAKEYETQGAGEILLTSVDKDGTTLGYDIELLKIFSKELNIPIIINGGMGNPEHGVEALYNGADALAAAYIFHFSRYTPKTIKEALESCNIPVRIN